MRAWVLVAALLAAPAFAGENALRISAPLLGLEYARELVPGLWAGPRANYALMASVPLFGGGGMTGGRVTGPGYGLFFDLAVKQRNRAEPVELAGFLAAGLAGYQPDDGAAQFASLYASGGAELGVAGFWLTAEVGGFVPRVASTSEPGWRLFGVAKLSWQLEF